MSHAGGNEVAWASRLSLGDGVALAQQITNNDMIELPWFLLLIADLAIFFCGLLVGLAFFYGRGFDAGYEMGKRHYGVWAVDEERMSDVLEGRVSPGVCNATVNAGGKLLKIVELQQKYGKMDEDSNERTLLLTDAAQKPKLKAEARRVAKASGRL
jgi:hypothetical protein